MQGPGGWKGRARAMESHEAMFPFLARKSWNAQGLTSANRTENNPVSSNARSIRQQKERAEHRTEGRSRARVLGSDDQYQPPVLCGFYVATGAENRQSGDSAQSQTASVFA